MRRFCELGPGNLLTPVKTMMEAKPRKRHGGPASRVSTSARTHARRRTHARTSRLWCLAPAPPPPSPPGEGSPLRFGRACMVFAKCMLER